MAMEGAIHGHSVDVVGYLDSMVCMNGYENCGIDKINNGISIWLGIGLAKDGKKLNNQGKE